MSTISNIAKNFLVVREHDPPVNNEIYGSAGVSPKDVQQPSLTREVASVA